MLIDTETMKFSIPDQKIQTLKLKLEKIFHKNFCSAKQLSQITGHLSSMHLAVGELVRLLTRSLYSDIEKQPTWYVPFQLTEQSLEELKFWHKNINNLNGLSIKSNPVTSKIIFTDASAHSYGGFVCQRLSKQICRGSFSKFENNLSSTARELLAVKYVIESFKYILSKQCIQINVDSLNASRILSVGSPKRHLQSIAIDIFKTSLLHDIKLIPQWIPREQNTLADFYSKIKDTDDWSIDKDTFLYLQSIFGQYTYDRFADSSNRKTVNFNSKYFCPDTSGVNAFTYDWVKENNWICPPVSLIGDVLKHFRICKARGTLLVPVWQSAYYWPLLYPDGLHFAKIVKSHLVVSPFYTSTCNESVFHGYKKFKALALEIDAS